MLSTDELPGRLGPATSTDVLPNNLRKDGVRCREALVTFGDEQSGPIAVQVRGRADVSARMLAR
jgi:hypothetical protein